MKGPVAKLRHDLRTYLNQILGYSELLKDEVVARDAADLAPDLDKIVRAAHAILERIDRLLATPTSDLGQTDAAAAGAPESTAGAAGAAEKPSPHVLVVDDNEMNRDMLSRRLLRQGFRTTLAENGEEALAKIDEETFDLVLLDIMMPGKSGTEVLEEVRTTHSMTELPIIMVTAKSDSEEVVRSLELGANDYVTKPIDFPVVLARSRGQLALKEAVSRSELLARQLELRNLMIRRIFGRYLTDDVVSSLLENPEGLNLGGEKRKITVMMADLRGFTSMSERLGPEQVVAFLNDYLGAMTDVITAAAGTIDEFMGDGILVLFGAPMARPDHARAAVTCALRMQLAMADVNQRSREKGLPEFEMGIGLHTGEVVVGNIGSEKRAKYGVVGANVNLASRIESYTVGGQILVSQQTLDEAGEGLRVDSTIEVRPKGVQNAIQLFEIGGIEGEEKLALPERRSELVDLVAGVPVHFFEIVGKDASGEPHEGELVRLSLREAEIATDGDVPALRNLRIHLAPVGEDSEFGDLYAKTLGGGSLPGRIMVRFTSLPPEAKEFMLHQLGIKDPSEVAPG